MPTHQERATTQIDRVLARIFNKDSKDFPSADMVRSWHAEMMAGLMDDPDYEGDFRDEDEVPDALNGINVGVGSNEGAHYKKVLGLVKKHFEEFDTKVKGLDDLWPRYEKLGELETAIDEMIKLAAWAHGEWVWIHPFACGNGRTARLWISYVFNRYGLPAVQIRPRPGVPYGEAGRLSMEKRDHSLMEFVVYQLADKALRRFVNTGFG